MNKIEESRIFLANKLGLKGMKVIGWLEPQTATQDAIGHPILTQKHRTLATESEEDNL